MNERTARDECTQRLGPERGEANRGMVPRAMAPSAGAGTERAGTVQSGARSPSGCGASAPSSPCRPPMPALRRGSRATGPSTLRDPTSSHSSAPRAYVQRDGLGSPRFSAESARSPAPGPDPTVRAGSRQIRLPHGNGHSPAASRRSGPRPRSHRHPPRRVVRDTRVRSAPTQSRRLATSSASDGFVWSRSDRIGRPSDVPGTGGQGTPTAGSSHAKPSSSDPSNSFVTR